MRRAGSCRSCSARARSPRRGRSPRWSRPRRPPSPGPLIANPAVPVWHEARRELPFVFGSGAVATAGALATLVTPAAHAAPARRMLVGGAVAELAAVEKMEHRLGELGEPY